jgi:hypothetical protein
MRRHTLAMALTLTAGSFALLAACGRGAPSTAAGSGAAAQAALAPVAPMSARILGRWEHTTPAATHAFAFRPGELVRWVNGTETARQPWRTIEERSDEIVVALRGADGDEVAVYRLESDDAIVHAAAPDIVFRRVEDALEASGEASGEGSGTAPSTP